MADRDEKSLEDCYYFLYSNCRKGDECEYRHRPESKTNPVLCERWSQTKVCTQDCPLRHSYHHLKKKRTDDQCYWETQEGGCTRKFCEFRHRDPQKDAWRVDGGRPADSQYKTSDDPGRRWSDEKPKRRMWQDPGTGVEGHPPRGDSGFSGVGSQSTPQLNGSRWFKNRSTAPDNSSPTWTAPEQHGDAPAPFQGPRTTNGADINIRGRGVGHSEPSQGRMQGNGRGTAARPPNIARGARHEDDLDEGPLNEELRELDDLLHEFD